MTVTKCFVHELALLCYNHLPLQIMIKSEKVPSIISINCNVILTSLDGASCRNYRLMFENVSYSILPDHLLGQTAAALLLLGNLKTANADFNKTAGEII